MFKCGKLNPNYVDGITSKKHFCVDCHKEIFNRRAKRCKSCENKRRHREGILNSKRSGTEANRYIDGKTLKKYFCKDCNKKISWQSALLGKGRCYSCANKKERNPSWQNGASFLPYPPSWTNELKLKIRFRDNYTCQLCGVKQKDCKRSLEVHHINYIKSNCGEENLISLCPSCHIKTGKNRKYWIKYFNGQTTKRKIEVLS